MMEMEYVSTDSASTTTENYINSTISYQKADKDSQCALYHLILLSMVGGTLCAGMIGNILSFATFWQMATTNSTAFLLAVLAVLDNGILLLQFLLNSVPGVLRYFRTGHAYMNYVYPVLSAYGWPAISIFHLASVWNIVLIMYYRYLAVCRPHRMANFASLRNARIHVTLIALCSILYYIPAMSVNILRYDGERIIWTYHSITKSTAYFIYDVPMYYIIIYIIPFSMLIAMTVFLTKELRQSSSVLTKKRREEHNITKTLMCVCIVFIICQIANPVRRLTFSLSKNLQCGSLSFYVQGITPLFIIANSAVNFVIYCLCGRNFRNRLLKMIRCRTKIDQSPIGLDSFKT